ncbi:MAG: putative virulence factor [Deltaproteobacteria bacterium]|jgi:hypothetical protein|nr:putative virulence factor [Deltaproteobacteria bacterium]
MALDPVSLSIAEMTSAFAEAARARPGGPALPGGATLAEEIHAFVSHLRSVSARLRHKGAIAFIGEERAGKSSLLYDIARGSARELYLRNGQEDVPLGEFLRSFGTKFIIRFTCPRAAPSGIVRARFLGRSELIKMVFFIWQKTSRNVDYCQDDIFAVAKASLEPPFREEKPFSPLKSEEILALKRFIGHYHRSHAHQTLWNQYFWPRLEEVLTWSNDRGAAEFLSFLWGRNESLHALFAPLWVTLGELYGFESEEGRDFHWKPEGRDSFPPLFFSAEERGSDGPPIPIRDGRGREYLLSLRALRSLIAEATVEIRGDFPPGAENLIESYDFLDFPGLKIPPKVSSVPKEEEDAFYESIFESEKSSFLYFDALFHRDFQNLVVSLDATGALQERRYPLDPVAAPRAGRDSASAGPPGENGFPLETSGDGDFPYFPHNAWKPCAKAAEGELAEGLAPPGVLVSAIPYIPPPIPQGPAFFAIPPPRSKNQVFVGTAADAFVRVVLGNSPQARVGKEGRLLVVLTHADALLALPRGVPPGELFSVPFAQAVTPFHFAWKDKFAPSPRPASGLLGPAEPFTPFKNFFWHQNGAYFPQDLLAGPESGDGPPPREGHRRADPKDSAAFAAFIASIQEEESATGDPAGDLAAFLAAPPRLPAEETVGSQFAKRAARASGVPLERFLGSSLFESRAFMPPPVLPVERESERGGAERAETASGKGAPRLVWSPPLPPEISPRRDFRRASVERPRDEEGPLHMDLPFQGIMVPDADSLGYSLRQRSLDEVLGPRFQLRAERVAYAEWLLDEFLASALAREYFREPARAIAALFQGPDGTRDYILSHLAPSLKATSREKDLIPYILRKGAELAQALRSREVADSSGPFEDRADAPALAGVISEKDPVFRLLKAMGNLGKLLYGEGPGAESAPEPAWAAEDG